MPVTINGTTGVSGVDGSASTPAVRGSDTNTGVFYPAADVLAFTTNGTEDMRINAAGGVLVNTTTQTGSTRLVVADSSGAGQIRAIHSTGSGLLISQVSASGDAAIQLQDNANLQFATNNSERMRIDSSGNVGIGTSSPSTALHVVGEVTATQGVGGYPAFNAYASAAQTVTSATPTKIAINTENFDTNSNFNTTNNRFTPTVEGYYQVNGTVLGNGATTMTALLVFIYKNGVNIRRTGIVTSFTAGNNSQVSVSEVIYMNGTTDYIELYGQINGTGTLQFGFSSSVTTSSFSACLVRGA